MSIHRLLSNKAVQRVGLVVFGIGLALGIGEVASRLSWREAIPQPYLAPDSTLPAIEKSVFGLARPNARGVYRGVYYRSNSAGFRGPEYTPNPVPGVFRIAIVGDSFTMGDGVLEEKAYPYLLQQKLNEGDRRYEVLNFGLSGLTAEQIAIRIDRLVRRFHPHLIVYGFTPNDIEGPFYRKGSNLKAQIEQRSRYMLFARSSSHLLRQLWPRFQALRELLDPVPGTYLYDLMDNYFNNPAAWQDLENSFVRIAGLGDEINAPTVLFVHTILMYLNRFHPLRPLYTKVSNAAEKTGISPIASLPAYYGYRAEDLWVSEIDTHPNNLGHEILADALAKGLRQLGLLGAQEGQRTDDR